MAAVSYTHLDVYKRQIRNILEDEQYHTKFGVDNVFKVNCHSLESYRKLVRDLKLKDVFHHTYQLKGGAFRIVMNIYVT